jgi:hypothetical protein
MSELNKTKCVSTHHRAGRPQSDAEFGFHSLCCQSRQKWNKNLPLKMLKMSKKKREGLYLLTMTLGPARDLTLNLAPFATILLQKGASTSNHRRT